MNPFTCLQRGKSVRALIFASLLALAPLFSALALDYDDLVELLRHRVPQEAIINVVRQGVYFIPTEEQEEELSSLGASEELLAALAAAFIDPNEEYDPRLGDGTGEILTLDDLEPGTIVTEQASPSSIIVLDEDDSSLYNDAGQIYYEDPTYVYPPIVVDSSPTVIYESNYYDSYPYYESPLWSDWFYRPNHRPRPPPAHRPPPPSGRPPRPPGGRPPSGRPPGGKPPGSKPPGSRPPGGRPPGGRPPDSKPPGGRPPGGRPPGGRPPGGNRPPDFKPRPRNGGAPSRGQAMGNVRPVPPSRPAPATPRNNPIVVAPKANRGGARPENGRGGGSRSRPPANAARPQSSRGGGSASIAPREEEGRRGGGRGSPSRENRGGKIPPRRGR